jgi:hypothetical protein
MSAQSEVGGKRHSEDDLEAGDNLPGIEAWKSMDCILVSVLNPSLPQKSTEIFQRRFIWELQSIVKGICTP